MAYIVPADLTRLAGFVTNWSASVELIRLS